MITRIFLDLDDTLNVLTPWVLNAVGCKIGPTDYENYPSEFGYDLIDAANYLHNYKCFTAKSFWDEIERYDWANMPKSKEFDLLIELSQDAVGDDIFILTRATDNAECLAGKKDWMDQNLPCWLRNRYIIVGDDCKDLLANSHSLLIDDHYKNVTAFRKAGGLAFAMPRPWNVCRDVKDTKWYLAGMFAKIFGRRAA